MSTRETYEDFTRASLFFQCYELLLFASIHKKCQKIRYQRNTQTVLLLFKQRRGNEDNVFRQMMK